MRRACGSSAAVGSSRKTTSGSWTSAQAIESRWAWPPERSSTRLSALSSSPTRSSHSSAASAPTPYSEAKVWICSRAVSRSKNDDAWSCTPIRGSSAELRGQTDWPSTMTVPESGRRSPSMVSSVVVLPAPFGPRMPTNSPSADLEADAVDGSEVAVGHGEVDDLDRPPGHWLDVTDSHLPLEHRVLT